jgi:hypothetical protein
MWRVAAGCAWAVFFPSLDAIWLIEKSQTLQLTIWNAMAVLVGIPFVVVMFGITGFLLGVLQTRVYLPVWKKQAEMETDHRQPQYRRSK